MLHRFLEECRTGIPFHCVSQKQHFTLQTGVYSCQENDIKEFQSENLWIFNIKMSGFFNSFPLL